VRVVTVRGASTGSVVSRSGKEARLRERTVGFAVDADTRRAYVVLRDFGVAEVDLRTLAVREHVAAPRTLAAASRRTKWIEGSTRTAAWLGGGVLAAAGTDFVASGSRPQPRAWPIRLIDVGGWSARVLGASGLAGAADGVVLARTPTELRGFGRDGAERYRVPLAPAVWLRPAGGLGYACRNLTLVAVLDLSVGDMLWEGSAHDGMPCPEVLAGSGSDA